MINKELLEKYIEDSGYKRIYIAKKLGITAYGLALKISGKHDFKATEIKILISLLGIEIQKAKEIFFN